MARREHKRDLLDVLRRLEAQGHYRCVPPDRRGLLNTIAQLRRSGAQV